MFDKENVPAHDVCVPFLCTSYEYMEIYTCVSDFRIILLLFFRFVSPLIVDVIYL